MTTFRSYLNLTKPGIISGNLINATMGFFLASHSHFNLVRLLGMLAGLGLVVASACVFNNVLDRHLDAAMQRTKHRALVTGQVSVGAALTFGAALGLAGVAVLLALAGPLTAALGGAGFILYVVVYGYAKRHTPWSTVIGSLSGAVPPLAGYATARGHLDLGGWLIFLAIICWQMPHFYAIAIYRAADYQAADLPVLPLARGVRTTKQRIVWWAAAYLLAILALTLTGYGSLVFGAITLTMAIMWLTLCLRGRSTRDDHRWARAVFRRSLLVVLGLCVASALDLILQRMNNIL